PVLLIVLLSAAIACRHQVVAAQVPATPNQQAQAQQPPNQQAQSQATQTPGHKSQDPQTENQKPQNQPSPSPTTQSQPTSGQPGQDQEQEQASGDSGVFVFRKEVEEVVLHATAMDDKNRLVTSLDKSAFTIYENNQLQAITSFRHEDVPVAMGIVI